MGPPSGPGGGSRRTGPIRTLTAMAIGTWVRTLGTAAGAYGTYALLAGLAAAQQLADLDLPPEAVADTLEGMSGDLELKAQNVAMFVRNLEATAAAIKEAEARMSEQRQDRYVDRRARQRGGPDAPPRGLADDMVLTKKCRISRPSGGAWGRRCLLGPTRPV